MFALARGGMGAAAPIKKKRYHPEAAPAGHHAAEGSRADRVVPRAAWCRYEEICCKQSDNERQSTMLAGIKAE